ncbi:MAG: UDP-N-acetylmuramate--L-alanine ligase [Herpetosiphonaceae bacterium]|nr:UDP-N-acetylmuramate--L-alanine ligase [Herpetosiphonaceae bacterium]
MHYHVPGIAGAGMSAIAHLLLDQGHVVSGCDMQQNALTAELAERSVEILHGHDPAHLAGVDVVATSSALRSEHPELAAARALGIPVLKRADLWRQWSQRKPTLAIAGTHGKTTTTAMAALMLQQLGYDPAYIVPAGGAVPGLDRFARWGSGPFVIEADEYDRLFLGLLPQVAIITSVDWDHVDIYPQRADVEAAFAQFAQQTTGSVVICTDDAGASKLWQAEQQAVGNRDQRRWLPYGLQPNGGWWAGDIAVASGASSFTVYADERLDEPSGLVATIHVPGRHNVQNALGAAVGVYELLAHAVPLQRILTALQVYQGAARRFEWKGEAQDVVVIDDYAHNPPKVRAALQATRERYPARRLVVYFQPHTFSRTAALVADFAGAFAAADELLIGDIYPSRERQADFPGVSSAWLAQQIDGPHVRAVGNLDAAVEALQQLVQPGDVVLTLGAGDGNQVGDRLLRRLEAAGSGAA